MFTFPLVLNTKAYFFSKKKVEIMYCSYFLLPYIFFLGQVKTRNSCFMCTLENDMSVVRLNSQSGNKEKCLYLPPNGFTFQVKRRVGYLKGKAAGLVTAHRRTIPYLMSEIN
jgi:hypothetical protein